MTAAADIALLPSFAFGNTPQLADRLAALVIAGRKTATSWPANEGKKGVYVGLREVVLDGAGKPVCSIDVIAFEQTSFDRFNEAQARAYGEGDLTLAFWRAAHERYWTGEGKFSPDMPLYLETFRVADVLDAGFAATADQHVTAEINEAFAEGFAGAIQ